MDGKYDLTCPEMKDIVLKFSYIGMKPKSVVVGNKTVVDVTLESDSQEMDEVVVTGLLNRRKSGFAGTTTVISKQELAKVSTGNIFTTISTLDAGFKIEKTIWTDPILINCPTLRFGVKDLFKTALPLRSLFWMVLR